MTWIVAGTFDLSRIDGWMDVCRRSTRIGDLAYPAYPTSHLPTTTYLLSPSFSSPHIRMHYCLTGSPHALLSLLFSLTGSPLPPWDSWPGADHGGERAWPRWRVHSGEQALPRRRAHDGERAWPWWRARGGKRAGEHSTENGRGRGGEREVASARRRTGMDAAASTRRRAGVGEQAAASGPGRPGRLDGSERAATSGRAASNLRRARSDLFDVGVTASRVRPRHWRLAGVGAGAFFLNFA